MDWIPSDKENAEYDLVVAALREDLDGLITPSSLVFSADREPRQHFQSAPFVCRDFGAGWWKEPTRSRHCSASRRTALRRAMPPAAIALIERFDIRPRGPYAGVIGVQPRRTWAGRRLRDPFCLEGGLNHLHPCRRQGRRRIGSGSGISGERTKDPAAQALGRTVAAGDGPFAVRLIAVAGARPMDRQPKWQRSDIETC